MGKVDIAIIGAGVIGLATAYTLSNSGKDIIVIEKNPSFGQETSSRNSEVIHAGIYYPTGSLKSKNLIAICNGCHGNLSRILQEKGDYQVKLLPEVLIEAVQGR